MKKIILFMLLSFSILTFSMARVGTEVGDVIPTIEVEGFNSASILGNITVLKFWQST